MVVTVFWYQSWTVVAISLCGLCTAAVLLLCCMCWDNKKNAEHQFYILDENGIKKSTASEVASNNIAAIKETQNVKFYRRFSSVGGFKPSLSFLRKTDDNHIFQSLTASESNVHRSNGDLIDSLESSKRFDHTVLQLEDGDAKSCASDDSRSTFYSIYPLARTVSMADTMKSALSQNDLVNFV